MDGLLIKFKLNAVQLHYYYTRTLRTIIVKARQLGFTTFHLIDYLDDCLFGAHAVDVAFIMDTLAHAKTAFKKVDLAWRYFPLKKYFEAHTDSSTEIAFSTGSSMLVAADVRSGTYQRLHISELSKIDQKFPLKAEEILTGCIPTVPLSGRISNESTGRGDSGSFHDFVEKARQILHEGRKPFARENQLFFYSWTLDPKYQIFEPIQLGREAEEYMIKNNLTIEQARFWQWARSEYKKYVYQEFPTTIDEAFICADGSYFDIDEINARIRLVRKPILAGRDHTVWKNPEFGRQYVIGCDVAEGYGGDHSTIEVIDRETGDQVYEYCSNSIKVNDFSKKIYQIGKLYNWALVGVERNNHGHAVLGFLNTGMMIDGRMRVYPILYRQKSIDLSNNKPTMKLGWLTTGISKPFMLDGLDNAFSEESIKINSIPCLKEMRDFGSDDLAIRTIGTSRHFDRLIGIAIAWQMIKERPMIGGATKEEMGL